MAKMKVARAAKTAASPLQIVLERIAAGAGTPLRAAFHARALNAFADLAERLPDERLCEILAESSNVGTLLAAMGQDDVIDLLRREDPLNAARLRAVQARQELLNAEGGVLSGEAVAARLGVTRQAVDKRRRAGTLLAVDTGRRGHLYPAWQLNETGALFGLSSVLKELADHPPWARMHFFLTGDRRLGGRTPLVALRAGAVDEVRRAARNYGEHGAD